MEKKTNTPALRFHGFWGEWEKKNIGDTFRLTRGEVLAVNKTSSKKAITMPFPVYSSQTANHGLMGYYSQYLFENAITWTTDGANAGTVNYRAGKFYCTNVCGVLLNDAGYANPAIATALNRKAWKYVSKVGNPKLMNNVMAEINIYMPLTIEEQKSISAFLLSFDALLINQEQKVKKLEQFRQAMLTKLFPAEGASEPALRFQGFFGPWRHTQISDIADVIGGGTPDTQIEEYWNGDIDWYTPAEMEGKRYANGSDRKITELGLAKSGARLLPAHRTVLFTSRAGIGKMAILGKDGATNQGFQSLVLNDYCDPYFIYTLGPFITKCAERIAAGSTFLEISGKALGALEIMIPTKAEQEKIAKFFEKLDDIISLQQEMLDKIQKLKAALLDKLFV